MPPGRSTGHPGGQAAAVACYRHPDRPTGLRCSRCERPACPECLREASVGYQCVDCVAEGHRTMRRPRDSGGITRPEPGRKPVVVPVLILVNIAVFVVTVVQARSLSNNNASTVFLYGGLLPAWVAHGAWWQLLTSGFLHYGPIHIAMNMLSLWFVGKDLELVLGRVRFTAIYLVSLFGGGVSVFLFSNPNGQTAGASGAIFGLLGALLVVVFKLRLNPGQVIMWIVINLVLTFAVPGISILGHIGGLVTGAGITAAMVYAPARNRPVWQAGAVVAIVVVLVGLALVRYGQFGVL